MNARLAGTSKVILHGQALRTAILLSLGGLAACGGGTPGGGGMEPNPEISISISPTSATVEQGGATMTTATVTGSGGFSGTATITVTGAPSGVTASVGDVSTSGSTTTGTVTINVGAAVTPGQYDITVRASGSGVSAVTKTFTLNVTGAPAFALSVQPAALSIDQGDEAETTVTITRTNFTGSVTLSLEGPGAAPPAEGPAAGPLPSGVSGTFAPNPTTGNSSTLTVTVDQAAQAQLHNLTIRATADGLDDRTASLALTVTEPSGPPPNIPVEPTEIAMGYSDGCRLNAIGKAYCWGADAQGELGDDAATVRKASPVAVAGSHTFGWITAGSQHTCGLDTMGQAWCWGGDDYGQLGDGAPKNVQQHTPVQVTGGLTFIALTSGANTSCGLTAAGQAYCWGSDLYDELGDGPGRVDQLSPVPVSGPHTFGAISAGTQHVCALDLDGKAWCWGSDGSGQLGDGAPVQGRDVPVAVAGNHTFVSISAGAAHSCAIDEQGHSYCWGSDTYGELGDGAGSPDVCGASPCSFEPVAVSGMPAFVSLIAGKYFQSCGFDAAGSASCWGRDWNGQLGDDGAIADKSAPVPVAGGHLFREISPGGGSTCGVDMVGDAWCWGDDTADQLGDGPGFVNRPTPVKVGDLP